MNEKTVRIVAYVTPSLRRQLKAALALKGLGYTEWVKEKALQEIENQ